MTKEDKQLLLKDLCARLPYGVKVSYKTIGWEDKYHELSPEIISNMLIRDDVELKPYLRPMSSMTEEEREEYHSIQSDIWKPCGTQYYDNWRSIDWLNANHFDYRGLIPKGLAIEVTKENNPYK